MIPYNQYQLPQKYIEKIKKRNAQRSIMAYIKRYGAEPDSAITAPFYVASEADIELYRRVHYSLLYSEGKTPNEDPILPINTDTETIDDSSHTYYICTRKAPWTEEEAEQYKDYIGMEGCSYEFIRMSYNNQDDYYFATNIDTTQFITCYGDNEDGNWRNPPANTDFFTPHVEFAFTKGTTLADLDPLCYQSRNSIDTWVIIDDKGKSYRFENWIVLHANQQTINELRMAFYNDHSDKYVRFTILYLDGTQDERSFLLR